MRRTPVPRLRRMIAERYFTIEGKIEAFAWLAERVNTFVNVVSHK